MSDWLLVVATIFGVNLLPAFGPPTWAVLLFFRLDSDLPAVPLVLVSYSIYVDWAGHLKRPLRTSTDCVQ